MSDILLETSAFSRLLAGDSRVEQWLDVARSVAMSPVAIGELLCGFAKSAREQQNRVILEDFMRAFAVRVLEVGRGTAERYAAIWLALRRQGRLIPSNDMWIAASAMEYGLQVLTADRHFLDIPGVFARLIG